MKLQLIKKSAIAAALSLVAVASFAMTPMQDEGLSQVSGQDGVSIAADLKVNIHDFTYTNTAANGGSVSFNNIKFNGLMAATLDVINSATFVAEMIVPNQVQDNGTNFYTGGDVVRIAVPTLLLDTTKLLSVSVDSIKMGGANANTAASFGKFAMNQIDLRGTTAYIWAH
jgi:hypothetical protein